MLDGEIALVTGAKGGIGAAAAKALAEAGARVIVTARRLADAEAVAGQCAEGRALGLACDVADPEAVRAAVREATALVGAPTLLVNNAGTVQPIGLLHETDADAWAANINATLIGAAAMARAVLPAMLDRGGGAIVNLSSGAAHRAMEGWSAYCAAKAGLAMVTKSLALEYGARGIRAFGFAPGIVDTGMQVEIRASGINPVSKLPREALASVDDPAKAIVFLCTSAAGDLAGLEVDIREASFRERAGLPALPAA
ncbi:SDR family NAD(P)-dependent oxidoreductase [Kaistia nematophila]|uniref:SDR family NAD(P)-dependent oxidoreductase n=1 Tax=Kaistia nematophila TaxID=2994654 RepID=A0A9X3E502_9HYPH|nr:SDR family oxidoreductase [Kaistia nematophila]MCX5571946.1 SDR family NAD(P)-dependent oxidoreductase [Kaistia nematophila]